MFQNDPFLIRKMRSSSNRLVILSTRYLLAFKPAPGSDYSCFPEGEPVAQRLLPAQRLTVGKWPSCTCFLWLEEAISSSASKLGCFSITQRSLRGHMGDKGTSRTGRRQGNHPRSSVQILLHLSRSCFLHSGAMSRRRNGQAATSLATQVENYRCPK